MMPSKLMKRFYSQPVSSMISEAFAPFDKEGVDHAVRSVEVVEPLLKDWGFPSSKFDQVKEMILTHTYYTNGSASRELDMRKFLIDLDDQTFGGRVL